MPNGTERRVENFPDDPGGPQRIPIRDATGWQAISVGLGERWLETPIPLWRGRAAHPATDRGQVAGRSYCGHRRDRLGLLHGTCRDANLRYAPVSSRL